MSNPQRPLTPGERSARVASRVFPGGGGGFVSGVAPVRPRPKGKVTAGGNEASAGIGVYVQPDEPADETIGTLWFDTDETCVTNDVVTSINGMIGDVVLVATDVGAIPVTEKGAANGVATLGSDTKVPLSQLPVAAGGITVQDENGTLSTSIVNIDFQGTGVTATPGVAGEVIVTIPTGGHTVADEGTNLPQRLVLDFAGTGVAATDVAGRTLVTVPGLAVQDETIVVKSGVTSLDFQGAGVVATDGGNGKVIVTVNTGGGGSGHIVADEGTPLAGRTNLNFVGTGVTVTDSSGTDSTVVTIPGGISVQDENGTAITGVTQIDFQGAGVTAATGTGEVIVTIPGSAGHIIYDEGTAQTTRGGLNFVGAGVVVTDDATNNWSTVTIPGAVGGGSGHVIADEGVPLTPRANLDFVGTGVAVTDDSSGGRTVVTVNSPPAGTGTGLEFSAATNTGADQTRTTGGAFQGQEAVVWVKQPIRIDQIKWDIGAAGTYSVTVDQATFGSSQTIASRTADVTFTPVVPPVLMPGEHRIRCFSTGAAVAWDDNNTIGAGGYIGTLFNLLGVYYDGTYFSTFQAPMRLVAEPGTWVTSTGVGSGGGVGGSGSAPGTGLRYYTSNQTVEASPTVPVTDTLVATMAVTIPSSTLARMAFVSYSVVFIGSHTNRFSIFLDGVKVWPGSTNVTANLEGSNSFYDSTVAAIPIPLSAGAAHTIDIRWNASDSTAAVTWHNRSLIADVYDATSSPVSIGGAPSSGSATTSTPTITKRQDFTATAGQVNFTLSTVPALGTLRVYQNGLLLRTSDFTTSGSSLVLVNGAILNDNIIVLYDGITSATLIASTAPSADDIPASPNAADYEFNADNVSSLPSGWSWINQGTSTYLERYGAGIITIPTASSAPYAVRAITRSASTAATYEYRAKINRSAMSSASYNAVGLGFSESSTGKIYTTWLDSRGLFWIAWNSVSSFSSQSAIYPVYLGSHIYLAVRKNSASSWDLGFSTDGRAWQYPLNNNPAAFLTTAVDQISFFMMTESNNGPQSASIEWFRKVS